MRKLLLNNLMWLVGFGLFFSPSTIWAQKTPYFLVVQEGINFKAAVAKLITLGAEIKRKIPSTVIVADLPNSLATGEMKEIKSSYGSAIPLAAVENMGPLVVAAALHWNENLVHQSKISGASAYASMQSLVSKNSLPAPEKFSLRLNGSVIEGDWETALGSSLYEIQLSRTSDFKSVAIQSYVLGSKINLPIPLGEKAVYGRVRSLDKAEDKVDSILLRGDWSSTKELTHAIAPTKTIGEPPQLSSPVDKIRSEGFTLILEWDSHAGEKSRIQMAENSTFSSPLIDLIVSEREFVVPSNLMDVGQTYFWRVQAYGSTRSDWSDSRQVTIEEPRTVGADMFINPERSR